MAKKIITILGIETSCDETAASLIRITNLNEIRIISNIVSSQVKIHAKYKGIVPEVAARHHVENIIPVLEKSLEFFSNKKFRKIGEERSTKIHNYLRLIDAIAVTNGPGLITSLLVGVEAAKTLAFLANKPLVPVNHLAGHIYANFVDKSQISNLKSQNLFPALCLVVSGGHTELILMKDFEKFQKIGQTLDDAAGECFDKVAKILGLGYPGGPAVAAEAANLKSQISNLKIKFPRPMINTNDFNFSFSGLKTAVLYKTNSIKQITNNKNFVPEICAEVQQAIIDVLITKTIRAARKFNAKSIILGGGVVANKELRKQFKLKIENWQLKINPLFPPKNLCTDNATMIAAAGYFKLAKVKKNNWLRKFNWRKIKVDLNSLP